MKNKRLLIILSFVPVLLLIPLIAMQFTSEVNWTGFDFLVMAVLLTVTGLLFEFFLRIFTSAQSRLIACSLLVVAFILVWIELAVGVFGSPIAGS
ncbi:hypothetical protein [Formosa sp. S-31]|uniref:hypothetical protein n=1 Tax=Formosa sp. S-31 TaxID=2790949 RepID=UPI003EC0BAF2